MKGNLVPKASCFAYFCTLAIVITHPTAPSPGHITFRLGKQVKA